MYITANGHIKINVGDDNLCMSGANNSFYPKTIGRAVIITICMASDSNISVD